MITKYSQLPGVKTFKNINDAFSYILDDLTKFHLKNARLVKKSRKASRIGAASVDNRR